MGKDLKGEQLPEKMSSVTTKTKKKRKTDHSFKGRRHKSKQKKITWGSNAL